MFPTISLTIAPSVSSELHNDYSPLAGSLAGLTRRSSPRTAYDLNPEGIEGCMLLIPLAITGKIIKVFDLELDLKVFCKGRADLTKRMNLGDAYNLFGRKREWPTSANCTRRNGGMPGC
jgi:hypothetical protein